MFIAILLVTPKIKKRGYSFFFLTILHFFSMGRGRRSGRRADKRRDGVFILTGGPGDIRAARGLVGRAIRKVLAESPEKFDPRDYMKPAREATLHHCLVRQPDAHVPVFQTPRHLVFAPQSADHLSYIF